LLAVCPDVGAANEVLDSWARLTDVENSVGVFEQLTSDVFKCVERSSDERLALPNDLAHVGIREDGVEASDENVVGEKMHLPRGLRAAPRPFPKLYLAVYARRGGLAVERIEDLLELVPIERNPRLLYSFSHL
jgi:hypothetical protein